MFPQGSMVYVLGPNGSGNVLGLVVGVMESDTGAGGKAFRYTVAEPDGKGCVGTFGPEALTFGPAAEVLIEGNGNGGKKGANPYFK